MDAGAWFDELTMSAGAAIFELWRTDFFSAGSAGSVVNVVFLLTL